MLNLPSNLVNLITVYWNHSDKPLLIKGIFAVTISTIFLKKAIDFCIANWKHHKLMQKADQKRIQRDLTLSRELGSLPEVSQELTNLILNANVSKLSELLNEDKVTSEQILVVYHRRAITHGLKLGLIAESNFKEALERARKCDELRKTTPKHEREKLGVLFGIPICIKDGIEQKGLDSASGRATHCFAPCKEDRPIVTVLKEKGAIPFIRSNLPQAHRTFDCKNNLWGVGVNPWNFSRSPGGSSSGDAGLIAARCTPISLGSDAYGSIRIPCAFDGVYGIKPTAGRFVGSEHLLTAFQDKIKFSFLHATLGPLGRCTEDLKHLVKAMITPESRLAYPFAPSIPWSEEKYLSKESLKIGYVVSEEFFEAAEPCQRAVREAIQALKKRGHQVVEVKIPQFEEIALSIIRLLFAEGKAKSIKDALGGEKPVESLALLMKMGETPNIFKKILKFFSGPRTGKLLEHTEEMSPNELVLFFSRLMVLRGDIIKWWTDLKLDAIVAPPCALPAFKQDQGGKLLFAGCYLWTANLCNLPNGVLPVTKVRAEETKYSFAKSKYQNDLLSKESEKCMEGSAGLPVGVQVWALPWEDETCLRVMKEIEDEIKFHEVPNFENLKIVT